MISENELNPAQKYKMEQVLFGMKKNKRNFVKKYGMKAEALMRKRALKIAKQYIPEPTIEEMEHNRLKKLVQDVLSKPLEEKKKSFPDLTEDGKVTKADILKGRGIELEETNLYSGEEWSITPEGRFWVVAYRTMDGKKEKVFQSEDEAREFTKTLNEDLDLGHEDDEPHMVKGELYKIAQNAMALYKMLEPFDKMEQEVDLPAWWQSKITKACTMLGSAKSYLEFELKEPQIDAMTNVMSQEDVIDEGKLTKKEERIVKALKRSKKFEKDDPKMYAIAKSLAETILQHIKNKK